MKIRMVKACQIEFKSRPGILVVILINVHKPKCFQVNLLLVWRGVAFLILMS